jgi:hypothetical protein
VEVVSSVSLMAASNMLMLNWNVRGLNALVKRSGVRDMVMATHATVICIQEMKLQHFDERLVNETLGQSFSENFSSLPANGTCGGILIAVAGNHFMLVSSSRTCNTITVRIQMLNDGSEWSVGGLRTTIRS